MNFNLDEYVDVAGRLREFYERHPQGTMQGQGEFVRDEQGRIFGYIYRAEAYRDPDDIRPGVGTAFEPIPGTTPYTRNSEVQNAETSAWGRAIVACGFETKKIASAEEVRNRSAGEGTESASEPTVPSPAEQMVETARQAQAEEKAARTPTDNGQAENVRLEFGKYKGQTLAEIDTVNSGYIDGFLLNPEKFQPKDEHKRRVLEAAKILRGQSDLVPAGGDPYPDIPFAPVPV